MKWYLLCNSYNYQLSIFVHCSATSDSLWSSWKTWIPGQFYFLSFPYPVPSRPWFPLPTRPHLLLTLYSEAPQNPVLRYLLYWINSVGNFFLQYHGFKDHINAEDSQIYTSVLISTLGTCIQLLLSISIQVEHLKFNKFNICSPPQNISPIIFHI